MTANLAALDVMLTAEQIAQLDAVSKPALSFPAGYTQISQMFGFPGTTIDGADATLTDAGRERKSLLSHTLSAWFALPKMASTGPTDTPNNGHG